MICEANRHQDGLKSAAPLFSAQPNAGLPTRIGNRFFYVATPDYFADYALRFAQAGVRLIGGCCGTTPRHIAAMRKALDEHYGTSTHIFTPLSRESEQAKVTETTNGNVTLTSLIEEELIVPQQGTLTQLQEKLPAREFVVSVG